MQDSRKRGFGYGLQDGRMSGNIQDIARLITRLLLQGDMPQYTLPAAEVDYTEADQLFSKIIGLADEGDINGAENELLMNMEDDDPEYLELALHFIFISMIWTVIIWMTMIIPEKRSGWFEESC